MTKEGYKRFTLQNFSRIVIKRQDRNHAGTNVVIYGPRRSGKTTLGFKIIIPYISNMRKLYTANKRDWNVPRGWKEILVNYFGMSCGDMNKKMKNSPRGSISFVDEGDDIFSWMNQFEREQKELTQLILKIGCSEMLTVILVPSMKLFSKAILSEMDYLFIIPSTPRGNVNTAHVLRNYENPILKERIPFGFIDIEKKVLKNPKFYNDENFDMLLEKNNCYITKIKFTELKPEIYNLYDEIVKQPSIQADKHRNKSVSLAKYKSMEYYCDTLLSNLYMKDNKSVAQIERLGIDKFGFKLISRNKVQDRLNFISAIEARPETTKEDISFQNTTDEEKEKDKHIDIPDISADDEERTTPS